MAALVVVLAAIFLGERVTRAKVASLVLGLAGVSLIAYPAITDPTRSGALGAILPLVAAAGTAVQSVIVKRLGLRDWHNFRADYARTLAAWRTNFDHAWPRLSARYDERFRRMWHFYLDSARANFACRRLRLWQLVLSPRGVRGGYRAPR